MSMGVFDLVGKLINEHGSAGIRGERIVLLREQLQCIEAEYSKLEDENRELKEIISDLQDDLEGKSIPDEFVEYRGALFRRQADGFENEAYCPRCKIPMSSLQNVLPYDCSDCSRSLSFTGRELKSIIAEIDQ